MAKQKLVCPATSTKLSVRLDGFEYAYKMYCEQYNPKTKTENPTGFTLASDIFYDAVGYCFEKFWDCWNCDEVAMKGQCYDLWSKGINIPKGYQPVWINGETLGFVEVFKVGRYKTDLKTPVKFTSLEFRDAFLVEYHKEVVQGTYAQDILDVLFPDNPKWRTKVLELWKDGKSIPSGWILCDGLVFREDV